MVKALSSFLDFCYLVRRSVHTEATLKEIDNSLSKFHRYRKVFEDEGVRPGGLSIPRQHSLVHYKSVIQLFGSPNGLCSSITESKHIKAVKEPWRRSSRYKALGQMLLTNQRLDKLAASKADFTARGMLSGPLVPAGHILKTISIDGENIDSTPQDPVGEPEVGGNVEKDLDDDDDVVSGPRMMAEVILARTPGMSSIFFIVLLITLIMEP